MSSWWCMHFWLEIVAMFISASIRNGQTAVHRFLILAIFKNRSKQKAFLPCIKLVLNRSKNERHFFSEWKDFTVVLAILVHWAFWRFFLKTFQVCWFVEDWAVHQWSLVHTSNVKICAPLEKQKTNHQFEFSLEAKKPVTRVYLYDWMSMLDINVQHDSTFNRDRSWLQHGTTSVGSIGHHGVRTCSCVAQLRLTDDRHQLIRLDLGGRRVKSRIRTGNVAAFIPEESA